MKQVITALFLSAFVITNIITAKVYAPIPGASEKFDTEGTIQKLLEVEKLPMVKLENENKDLKIEVEILKDFDLYVKDLDTKTADLYNYKSPFKEMLGSSTDPSIVEALADRNAMKKDYKVKVIQVAKPDAFMSESVTRYKTYSPGMFTIQIGKDIIPIQFYGGTIDQLAATLIEQAGDKLEVRIIKDTADTSILYVSGKKTGAAYKISFSGDLRPLNELGMLVQGTAKVETKAVNFIRIISISTNIPLIDSKKLLLKPGTDAEIDISLDNVLISPTTIMTYLVSIKDKTLPSAKSNDMFPKLPEDLMGNVVVSNLLNKVTVEGPGLIPFFMEPEVTIDVVSNFTRIMTVVFDDGSILPINLTKGGKYTNNLVMQSGKHVSKIIFKNENTHREYTIEDLSFITILADGGIQPKNSISKACDSIITIDGIKIVRDNNTITNVVNGVTFSLKRESPAEILITIDHDYELVKKSVMDWVDSYNKVMSYLSILTKPNLDKTPLYLRPDTELANGIYQTESTFNNLKNKLRVVISGAYVTSLGGNLALLSQAGIYTKKPGDGSLNTEEWENVKAGLLKVDTAELEKSMKTKFDAFAELFGNDTDNDNIKDTGVAIMAKTVLNFAVGTTGFVQDKIKKQAEKMKNNDKEIAKIKIHLEEFEQQKREEFGKMNQAIIQSQSQQKWMENNFK
ncbi:MAG: hypothetical protein A2Y33_15325 [Spirochaetes bacterium GWF1_51_8]|nr:MAG: hypothetical protein A2Y33_15325 [Spirochaetes bacterium GWF1_51_8]